MSILVPNYYHQFKCIADKCKHSCCIGWEIDIDADTAMYYSTLSGEMGDRIRNNISKDTPPHFILKQDDKCPFLNDKGLCDIIIKLGEGSVCEICREHPRFYNEYTNFTEAGLGLCCEEAARIILNFSEPFKIVGSAEKPNEDEKFFINRRNEIFKLLQQRDMEMTDRFTALANKFDFEMSAFSIEELCRLYLSLERLDESWGTLLEDLQICRLDPQIFGEFSVAFEQLACYFIFRHLTGAMYDGDYAARVKFAISGCHILGALLCRHKKLFGGASIDDLVEYARRYSAEVEYSEENMLAILNEL